MRGGCAPHGSRRRAKPAGRAARSPRPGAADAPAAPGKSPRAQRGGQPWPVLALSAARRTALLRGAVAEHILHDAKGASSGTPLISSMPSVRAKRAARISRASPPMIGRRSSSRSQASRSRVVAAPGAPPAQHAATPAAHTARRRRQHCPRQQKGGGGRQGDAVFREQRHELRQHLGQQQHDGADRGDQQNGGIDHGRLHRGIHAALALQQLGQALQRAGEITARLAGADQADIEARKTFRLALQSRGQRRAVAHQSRTRPSTAPTRLFGASSAISRKARSRSCPAPSMMASSRVASTSSPRRSAVAAELQREQLERRARPG